MKFLLISKEDIPEVIDLYLISFSDILKKHFKKKDFKQIIRDIIPIYAEACKDSFMVAKDKGKVIGFIIGTEKVWKLTLTALKKNPLKFFLTKRKEFISPPSLLFYFYGSHYLAMGVHPDYRHKGIGMELSKRNLKNMKKPVYFQVRTDNIPLIKMYEKLGFKTSKHYKNLGFEWMLMYKK